MIRKLIALFTYFVLFGHPSKLFSRAPVNGKLPGFSVFAISGEIENKGNSIIAGGIGVVYGRISGFNKGDSKYQIHSNDSQSIAEANRVKESYKKLWELQADSDVSVFYGGGVRMTPKVYRINLNSMVSGTLVLDGMGTPDSRFIFQMDGNLVIDSNVKVILINAASASNIYWLVNGNFTAGGNSCINGNIYVKGSLTLGEGSMVTGTCSSLQGSVSLCNVRIMYASANETQPDKPLTRLDASERHKRIRLTWPVIPGTGNGQFEIERSEDGMLFNTIGYFVPDEEMKSDSLEQYIQPANVTNVVSSFYRVKFIEENGKFTYSGVSYVRLIPKPSISVKVDKVKHRIMIVVNEGYYNHWIKFADQDGNDLLSFEIRSNYSDIDLGKFLPGEYVFKMSNKTGKEELRIKVIVEK
jgi:hypothetical protein